MVDLVLGLAEAIELIGAFGEVKSSAVCDALADNDTLRKEARTSYGAAIAAPAVAFARLRKGIHSLLPHLKGNTPSGHQFGILLGKSQAQAIPDAGGMRRWIKYRHTETGGLWRVEFVPGAAPADDDAESSAAREE